MKLSEFVKETINSVVSGVVLSQKALKKQMQSSTLLRLMKMVL